MGRAKQSEKAKLYKQLAKKLEECADLADKLEMYEMYEMSARFQREARHAIERSTDPLYTEEW